MFTERIEKFLRNNRVYIIPSNQGFYFIGTTVASIAIGVIYTNNTILFISFILFSLFLLHMFTTNYNLAGLYIKNFQVSDGYVSDPFKISLALENKSKNNYQTLYLDIHFSNQEKTTVLIEEILGEEQINIDLPFNLEGRGHYTIEKIVLWTRYPMGLFYAWSPLKYSHSFYAYPAPAGERLNDKLINHEIAEEEIDQEIMSESGNFLEHEKYNPSTSPNRIDWKLYARTQELYSKSFAQGDQKVYRLSIDPSNDFEKELSQLSLWIQELKDTPHKWFLSLHNHKSKVGTGIEHFKETMQQVTVYEK